jgi:hypothetical protein
MGCTGYVVKVKVRKRMKGEGDQRIMGSGEWNVGNLIWPPDSIMSGRRWRMGLRLRLRHENHSVK